VNRRALTAVALVAATALVACGGSKNVRHAPPGLHGMSVFLACSSPPSWHEPIAEREVCTALEEAFAEAGLEPILDKTHAALLVATQVSFHGDWAEYAAQGAKGAALDQARFDRKTCGSFASGGKTARCLAVAVVNDVLESRRINGYAQEWAAATSAEAASAAQAQPRAPLKAGARLAVLELTSKLKGKDAESVDLPYFADLARGAALRALPGVQVITRENLLVLLAASGKKPEDCEGECEVETGRLVGADLVVSGEVLRVGTHFKIDFKLHETVSARMLGQVVAQGHNVDELDGDTQRAIAGLVAAAR
jgi:hypothetical protein